MGPYLKSKNKTSSMMFNLLISLLPIILFSFYKNGVLLYIKGYANIIGMFYPLMFMLIGVLTSLLTEEIYLYVFKKKRGKELIDSVINGYAIFPGLFVSLVLPINTPLSILFLASVIAIVIGKMIFGGFGNNIFNPALVGCLFVIFCFSTTISNAGGYLNNYEVDTISSATPLTNVTLIEGIGTYDTLVKPYGSLLDFFIGFIPGSVGEVSALLCLVAFIYLTLTKTIKWRIPVFYISTVFIMTFIIGKFNNLGIWYPLFQILSGGLFFGSIFMATDPVTSPVNKESQVLYGIFLGIFTVIFRYLTSYPEGVLTSILLMNMFTFILDRKTSLARFKKYKYYLTIFLVLLLMFGVSYYISTTYKVSDTKVDSNYSIISKEVSDNKTTYIVSQKGFGGKIKAEIIFDNIKIISIDILEHNESEDRYKLITDASYIDKLLKEQTKVEEVDAISSATVTSTALKKMLINTIDDFKGNTKPIVKEEVEINIKNVIESGDTYIYTISFDSFGGEMELEATVNGNEIKVIRPKTYSDTCVSPKYKSPYYECKEYIEDNYLKTLIVNQDNLDSVDTISGATISSSSIKNAIKKLKESVR